MQKILVLAILLAAFAAIMPRVVKADEGASAQAPAAEAGKDAGKKEDDKGEGEKNKKDQDVSGGRFTGDPIYVHLAPMILPVISDAGAEQIITLQIAIEVKNFDAADSIHTNMPRVMDALMRALYGGLGNGDLRNGQLVNVDRIKVKAADAIGEVIGSDNVRNVLIEAIAQRKL